MATVRIFISPLMMTNAAVQNALPTKQYLVNTITNYTTVQPLNIFGSIPFSMATNTLISSVLQVTTNSYPQTAGYDKVNVIPTRDSFEADAIGMKGKVGQALGLQAQYGVSATAAGWEIQSQIFAGFSVQFRTNIAVLVQQGWLGCELSGTSLSIGNIISFTTNS